MGYNHTEYMREYRHRTDVRERINRYQRQYYSEHPELQLIARERAKKWYADHRSEVLSRRSPKPKDVSVREVERKHEWRNSAIQRLGGVCSKCGTDDKRVLQFDHINGGGTAARRANKGRGDSTHYRMIALMPEVHTVFQLLCANCNWIKLAENNEAIKRYR